MNVGTVVVTASLAFIATNGDDFVVLIGLQTLSRTTSRPRLLDIVIGQFVGFFGLVAVSVVGGHALALVPGRWLGLLGLVPLALGIRALTPKATSDQPESRDSRLAPTAIGGVALLTVVNGADNVVVYSVVFRHATFVSAVQTVVVFAALLALWCAASYGVAQLVPKPAIVGVGVQRIIPLMMIAIGLVILSRTVTG